MSEALKIAAERPIEEFNETKFSLENTGYQLQGLKQIHHEIVILSLLGYSGVEISAKLDVTEVMVSYTLNSKIVQNKLKILRKARDEEYLNVFDRIEELAPIALAEMENMLVNPDTNEVNRRQIAQDILDRAGYGAISKHADVTDHITTKDIDEIKLLAKESGFMVEAQDAEVIEETENEEEK